MIYNNEYVIDDIKKMVKETDPKIFSIKVLKDGYIEIKNKNTDCHIITFVRDKEFLTPYLPRLIPDGFQEVDKILIKKLLDYYLDNVVNYQ